MARFEEEGSPLCRKREGRDDPGEPEGFHDLRTFTVLRNSSRISSSGNGALERKCSWTLLFPDKGWLFTYFVGTQPCMCQPRKFNVVKLFNRRKDKKIICAANHRYYSQRAWVGY